MLRGRFKVGIVGFMSALLVLMPVAAGLAEISEISDSADTPIQFSWKSKDEAVLTKQQVDLNTQGAKVSKVQKQSSQKKSPLAVAWFIMAGAATVAMLADALVNVVKDFKHGGLIVDTRGDHLKIIENPALDRTTILMIQPDGKQVPFQYEQEDGPDLVTLLQTAVNGMKKVK